MADRKRFNADRTGAIRGDFDAEPESLSFIPLAREKGDADLWRFMGELRLTQGRLGEGASYLEAAANLDPDDAELHAELQRVHAVLWRDSTGRRPSFTGGATELDARRVGPVDPSAADPGPSPPLFAEGKTKKG